MMRMQWPHRFSCPFRQPAFLTGVFVTLFYQACPDMGRKNSFRQRSIHARFPYDESSIGPGSFATSVTKSWKNFCWPRSCSWSHAINFLRMARGILKWMKTISSCSWFFRRFGLDMHVLLPGERLHYHNNLINLDNIVNSCYSFIRLINLINL